MTKRKNKAPRGIGTVRVASDGTYRLRYCENGKQVTAPIPFPTYDAAMLWSADRLAKVARGDWQDPRTGSELLRVFAERELRMRTYSPLAQANAEWMWAKYLDPAFGDWPLQKITLDAVENWRSGLLANGAGEPTVRNLYNLLKSLMAAAEDKELIKRNPCRIKGASTPKTPKRRHVSYDDCMRVVDHLPPHLQPLATVAWWAAARKGEVLGMQWRDVDLTTGELHIRRQVVQVRSDLIETPPKWHSDRIIDLTGPGLDVLRLHHPSQKRAAKADGRLLLPSDRVFTNAKGGPLTPHAVDLAWRLARSSKKDRHGNYAKANLPHVTFHDLRRSSATAMLASGVTIHDLMMILGHENLKTTQRYLTDDPTRRPQRAADFAAYIERTSQRTRGESDAG